MSHFKQSGASAANATIYSKVSVVTPLWSCIDDRIEAVFLFIFVLSVQANPAIKIEMYGMATRKLLKRFLTRGFDKSRAFSTKSSQFGCVSIKNFCLTGSISHIKTFLIRKGILQNCCAAVVGAIVLQVAISIPEQMVPTVRRKPDMSRSASVKPPANRDGKWAMICA